MLFHVKQTNPRTFCVSRETAPFLAPPHWHIRCTPGTLARAAAQGSFSLVPEVPMGVEPQLHTGSTPFSSTTSDSETESFKELLKQLADDASQLIRQEIDLAKIELKESLSGYAADVARIGVAAVISGLGALTFTAFL